MRLLPRTLRLRIALLVSVLALAAALLASVAALAPVRGEMRTVVGDQQFALLSSTAAALDQDVGARRMLLRSVVEDFVRHGGHGANQLQALLEAHAVLREEFANVVVFDTAGQIIANLGDRRAVGNRDAAGSRTLLETIGNREGVVSPPFRSPLSGQPVILMTEPVPAPGGETVYVIGASISLANARIMGQFMASPSGGSAYFFLIDQTGTIIYHPDRSRVLANVWREPGGIMQTTRDALQGFEGWTEASTKNGRQALIAYKRMHRTGWIVGMVYPVQEAFAGIGHAQSVAWAATAVVTLAAALLGFVLTGHLLRPLARLRHRVQMLFDGQANIDVLDTRRADEIGELSRAFYRLSWQRLQAEQRLALLSRTDALTGLNNRRMFETELPAVIARAGRSGKPIALAYLDVDQFKRINDTHGHPVGDLVLIEFARRLLSSVREVDIVARLAGDEFVIIFEFPGSPVQIASVMEKLLAAIRHPFACGDGVLLPVTASMGLAYYTGPAAPATVLKAADEALYQAKAGGRDGWIMVQGQVRQPEAIGASSS
jgi:diguanylate cyclase (GGDEF)-like protein